MSIYGAKVLQTAKDCFILDAMPQDALWVYDTMDDWNLARYVGADRELRWDISLTSHIRLPQVEIADHEVEIFCRKILAAQAESLPAMSEHDAYQYLSMLDVIPQFVVFPGYTLCCPAPEHTGVVSIGANGLKNVLLYSSGIIRVNIGQLNVKGLDKLQVAF